MRKGLGIVLAVVGVLLIVAAVLLPTVIVPAGKKTPLDIDVTIVSTGPAKLLDATTRQVGDAQLRAVRHVKADKGKSDGSVIVVDETLCITVGGSGTKCPTTGDPTLLSSTSDRVASDRKTAMAVNDSKYGEKVNGKDAKHSGLSYKWPIGAKKKTYDFYNTDLQKAFPAKYVGTEKLQGLTVYKYVCATGDQNFQIQNILPGKYNDTRTVWIEPQTGTIIKGQEHQTQTLEGGQVALDTTLTFDSASQKNQADFAKSKIDQIKKAAVYAPIGAGVVGLLLLIGGLLMMRRRASVADGAEDRGARQDPAP